MNKLFITAILALISSCAPTNLNLTSEEQAVLSIDVAMCEADDYARLTQEQREICLSILE